MAELVEVLNEISAIIDGVKERVKLKDELEVLIHWNKNYQKALKDVHALVALSGGIPSEEAVVILNIIEAILPEDALLEAEPAPEE